jgi:hypothetical protein
MSLSEDGPSFLPETGQHSIWSLGKRITKAINPSFSEESLKMLQEVNYEFPEIQKLALESSLPVEKVDVFCPPCACAIQTAIRLCSAESTKLIRYIAKVDDRISVSCCAESTKIDRLNSLLTKIQEYEAGILAEQTGFNRKWIQYIDRVWIEQRIYHLETQLYTQEAYKTDHWSIAELLKDLPSKNSVFLGEIDRCLWILQTKPFPWTPRMPKENEIYELVSEGKKWHKKFLGSFTPRNFGTGAPSVRSASTQSTIYSGVSNSA